MSSISRVEYVNGHADAYNERDMLLARIRCERLVGWGPDGFVVMLNGCYYVHRSNGGSAIPPMIPAIFENRKWEFHDSYLRIMC